MATGGAPPKTSAIICKEVFDDGYQPSNEGKCLDVIMYN